MTQEVLAGSNTDSFTPSHLLAGDTPPIVTKTITLAAGQTFARHAVLGVNGSNQALLSLSAAGDGSEVAKYIACHDEDSSGGAKEIQVYAQGPFNEDALVYGTGHTADSVRSQLEDRSIFLKKLA